MNAEIDALLKRINNAWLQPKLDDLDDCFHDDVIFRGPNYEELCRGKAAAKRSYADFISQARIHGANFGPAVIDVWGDLATARYAWDVDYEIKEQRLRDPGVDLFVLQRIGGKWLAVCRFIQTTA